MATLYIACWGENKVVPVICKNVKIYRTYKIEKYVFMFFDAIYERSLKLKAIFYDGTSATRYLH